MRSQLLLLAGLCACSGVPSFTGTPTPPPDDVFVPRPQDEAEAIFADDVLHQIELTLSPSDFATLLEEPEAEVPGTLVIDGEPPIPEVGVKLRGGLGSFRNIDEKPKLGFDFNEFVPGRRVRGLEKLSLNSAVADCSYLREAAALHIFAAAGVPASRASFAQLTVNGEAYGLYVVLEAQDDRFLTARYEDNDGNLYDGKYRRDRWPFQRLDFGVDRDRLFELEEGAEVAHADILALSKAVKRGKRSDDFFAALDPVLDWGEVLRYLAVEQWIGQGDGYISFRNNYRVYFDPSDGKAELLAFDLDESFNKEDWQTASGRLAYHCWNDPRCAALQAGAVVQVTERIDTEAALAWLDAVDALTRAAAESDPRRECPLAQIATERAQIREWFEEENQRLLRQWGQ